MVNSNFMEVNFKALSINEGFARVCVAGFCVQLNPSIDEINDIVNVVLEGNRLEGKDYTNGNLNREI